MVRSKPASASIPRERHSLPSTALRFWRETWSRRARELVCWREHRDVWHAGHDAGWAGPLGIFFEAVVRCAELLGVGVAVSCAESVVNGHRFRRLTPAERSQWARYGDPRELGDVFVDEGAWLIARSLGIAFVVGDVVKAYGPPHPTLLMHELAHVCQFHRWGWAYVAKALCAQWGLGYRYAAGAPLATFNAEQEAAELEDRAREDFGLRPRHRA